jgi:hypothetical protein
VDTAILAAGRDHPPVPNGWPEAIMRASGPTAITKDELDALVNDCPDPRHGGAYGTMVIQAGAVTVLREQARELAARARQLTAAARYPSHGLNADGVESEMAASHLGKVAAAISKHADNLGPRTIHAAVQEGPDHAAEQEQREELVLAALLKPGRAWVRAMVEGTTPDAFRDRYRRAVFSVLTDMHRTRRPVDPLTVDWELASSGLPVYQGTNAGADGLSEETYTTRLARAEVAQDQAIQAAREMQREQQRGARPQAGRGERSPEARSQRRGRGTLGQVRAPGAEETWLCPRLVQRPPGRSAGGPDRGPQQAR